MWTAALWGLVQGLTEFLPISSSGHLVLVPALLSLDPPDLATSAVLHLGTLAAVVVYFRTDLARLTRFRTDPAARRLGLLLILATIPAAVAGLFLEETLDRLSDEPPRVGYALLVTGVVLLLSELIRRRQRTVADANPTDATVVGVAQATALVPGISRSGVTIVAGLGRGLARPEAARLSFLMAVPVIFGTGLSQGIELAGQGGLTASLWLGVAVAAASGYAAIAVLLRLLQRTGLTAFGVYCLAFGLLSIVVL